MPQACGFLELIQKRELSLHTVIDLSVVSLSITFLVVVLRCFIVAPGSKRQARRAHLLLPSDRTYLPARYCFFSPHRTPRCSPCHPRRRARRKSRGPGLGWQRPMQRRRKHRRRSPRTRSRGKCAGLPSPKRCAPIPVLLALACAVPSPFACTPSGAGALRKALHLCLGLRGCGEQWPQRHHDGKRIQGAVRRPAQRDA